MANVIGLRGRIFFGFGPGREYVYPRSSQAENLRPVQASSYRGRSPMGSGPVTVEVNPHHHHHDSRLSVGRTCLTGTVVHPQHGTQGAVMLIPQSSQVAQRRILQKSPVKRSGAAPHSDAPLTFLVEHRSNHSIVPNGARNVDGPSHLMSDVTYPGRIVEPPIMDVVSSKHPESGK